MLKACSTVVVVEFIQAEETATPTAHITGFDKFLSLIKDMAKRGVYPTKFHPSIRKTTTALLSHSLIAFIRTPQTFFFLCFLALVSHLPVVESHAVQKSCFDCLWSKLSSLASHTFIHKRSSKLKTLSAPHQLSVYSNRGEKGSFFFFIVVIGDIYFSPFVPLGVQMTNLVF